MVSDAAADVRRERLDVKAEAREHRAAVAAAAGAGAALLAADRQALRDALAAGDPAAADAARAKLDADRGNLRSRLAVLRQAAREEIGDARADLRYARKDLARARRMYDYELAHPRFAARGGFFGGRGSGGLVMTGSTTVSSGSGVVTLHDTLTVYNGDAPVGYLNNGFSGV